MLVAGNLIQVLRNSTDELFRICMIGTSDNRPKRTAAFERGHPPPSIHPLYFVLSWPPLVTGDPKLYHGPSYEQKSGACP